MVVCSWSLLTVLNISERDSAKHIGILMSLLLLASETIIYANATTNLIYKIHSFRV